MAYKYLVIVESPAKAKTIEKYLGKNYKVVASVGHVRDLPKSKMGIDVENNYEPHYISIRGKGDVIKSLRQAAKMMKIDFLDHFIVGQGQYLSLREKNCFKVL